MVTFPWLWLTFTVKWPDYKYFVFEKLVLELFEQPYSGILELRQLKAQWSQQLYNTSV